MSLSARPAVSHPNPSFSGRCATGQSAVAFFVFGWGRHMIYVYVCLFLLTVRFRVVAQDRPPPSSTLPFPSP